MAVHSRMYMLLRVWLIVMATTCEFLLLIPKTFPVYRALRDFDSGLFRIFFAILAILFINIFANVNFDQ